MSSVLIKDIFGKERPMPQEGYIDVRLHFRGGRIECATMQTGTPPFYVTFKVVEIPTPHGRLIDADETIRIWEGATIEGSIKPLIETRPTVIEPEGSEE